MLHPIQALSVMWRALADPAARLFSLAFSLFIALTYIIFYLTKRGELGELDA